MHFQTIDMNAAKNFVLAFLGAIVLYAISYHFIENRRTRNGRGR